MTTYVLRRYRCARPIYLYGRILSTGEVIRMPPADAAEHIESGHLVEIEVVNGSRWVEPLTR